MKLPYPYKKSQRVALGENKIAIKMTRNQGYIHSFNRINRNYDETCQQDKSFAPGNASIHGGWVQPTTYTF